MSALPPISSLSVENLHPKDFIIIKGAKTHNLKNLTVAIPRNQLVVVTGLSGSGKSSLILDTLFVEAQRMYIESVSAYARQFLGKLQKPPVDSILGLSPAIAIQQHLANSNPRSTVGTVTELCDYLQLLYARVGITYSPISGHKVKKDCVSDVVDYIQQQDHGTKVAILYPIAVTGEEARYDRLRTAVGKGFTRIMQDQQLFFIESLLEVKERLHPDLPIYGLVDRIVVQKGDQENQYRIADSVQVAFLEGKGHVVVNLLGLGQKIFSDRFELDGLLFDHPTPPLFNFNTPYGACKRCEGIGKIIGIDVKKVVPNPALSLAEGGIAPWNGPTMRKWWAPMLSSPTATPFPVHTPYNGLTPSQQNFLWKGGGDFIGIEPFFDFCATKTDQIHYRVLLARYRSKTTCPLCQGSRLRSDVHYIKISDHSIIDLLVMPIDQLILFFATLSLTPRELAIAKNILVEIKHRLHYLAQVGLDYLTLGRAVSTLSSGEYQRIKLATALGSPLIGAIYIFDEPTIGLHPRDTDRLVERLLALKNQGNTVIVIEHEEAVMRAADSLIEIGPGGGTVGGSLVFQGTFQKLVQSSDTHTARYLNGRTLLPAYRRSWRNSLRIQGATCYNLKQLSVEIPLNVLTVVTGVSGSGKSSLIKGVLYPALERHLASVSGYLGRSETAWTGCILAGDLHFIQSVELVNQSPLGKSSHSNPVTYLDIYDHIKLLFAQTDLARVQHYDAGHFSFKSPKGQCPACHGEGREKIEMQFMADIYLSCESCQGSRFKADILDVSYRGKNIAQLLRMTVDEAIVFFIDHPAIYTRLKVLAQVGLGYLQLGHPSSALSGGEGQRLKLAYYLGKKACKDQHILFIFDEPTTGLHMHDVDKLLAAMQILVNQGHTVVVIEHHLDVIKSADWLIDLGPDGGAQGGKVVFTGTPEALIQQDQNYTAYYLRKKM